MKHVILTIAITLLTISANANIIPNIGVVEKGKLYRSGQLSKKQFKRYIKRWGIKTIINLRGESIDKDWYKDEIEVSKDYNVEHFDIGMSAQRLPHREDLLKLISIYKTAERPILIHCRGGADRTGEAVAMYMIDYMGKSNKRASLLAQNIGYFHLEARFPAKKYFIKRIYKGQEWAIENYFPCEGNYKYYDTNSSSCK